LAGAVGEQNRHAQVMLMLVPLGFYMMLSEKRFWLRLLAALFTALITLGMATTFSRGAALGFVLALMFMTFMGYIKVKQILLVAIGVVLLFVALPQYGTRLLKLEGLVGLLPGGNFSISSTTSPDGALAGRTTSMLTALQVFVDHPLVGVGTGMFKFYYQDYAQFIGPRWEVGTRAAHDLYVGLLAENGLFGFLSFIAIVLITMRMLAQTRKSLIKSSPLFASIATGFIFSIVTYLGTGIGLHFGYYRFFWLIMALAFSAAHVTNESLPVPKSLNKNILINSPSNQLALAQESDQSL
jgi:O-antigen ligase